MFRDAWRTAVASVVLLLGCAQLGNAIAADVLQSQANSLNVAAAPLPVIPAAAPLPRSWAGWISALSKAGYEVRQGGAYQLAGNICDLYIEYFANCGGNNPVAPYFILQVPVLDGQYLDPYYATDFEAVTTSGTPVSEFYRIADNEAVAVIVKMPPRAAYLGYQSYIWTRDAQNYTVPPPTSVTTAVMPDPTRVPTFGSIGNDLNNVIMQQQAGAQWDSGYVGFITTSNSNLDAALRQVMDRKTRLRSKLLVTEPIGSFALTGVNKTADEFYTMLRYAIPEDMAAGQVWSDNPQNNIWVYRITDNTGTTVAREPAQAYTQKTAADESSVQSAMTEMTGLLSAYSTAHLGYVPAVSPMTATVSYDITGQLVGLVGQACIAVGVPCAGDNQDTDTYRVQIIGPLTGSQIAFTVGVDHTQFPSAGKANASYVSIGIYDAPTLMGVQGVWQTSQKATGFTSGTLTGSAQQMLQDLGLYNLASANLVSQLPFMYAVAVTRTCPVVANWCVAVSTNDLPLTDNIVLSERAYMKLGTTTGGNPNVMANPLNVWPYTASTNNSLSPQETSALTASMKNSFFNGLQAPLPSRLQTAIPLRP